MQIIRKLLVTVGLVVGLGVGPGWAQKSTDDRSLEWFSLPVIAEGVDAYQRGDYASAFEEFRGWGELWAQDAGAQYYLGFMHENGYGVLQDYATAVARYRQAAEQKHRLAQIKLGLMYLDGKSVEQDYVLAHMWFNLATLQYSFDDGYRGVRPEWSPEIYRNAAARKMTHKNVSKAQRLARECLAREYKNCGR